MVRVPRMPLHPASGGAKWSSWSPKSIRLVRFGCTNRHFFHIVVMESNVEQRRQPIEQVGTWDSCVNDKNEKLISLNFERIQHWLGQGNVRVSRPVAEIFGLCGFFPINPRSYLTAWRNRRAADQAAEAAKVKDEGDKDSASL